jgi:hypothetical protein
MEPVTEPAPVLPEGLAWVQCRDARQHPGQVWAKLEAGCAVAVVSLLQPGKPRLRAWYRCPRYYEPAWGSQPVTSGEHQRYLGDYWAKVAAGAVFRVEYGRCGDRGSNTRWPPGKTVAYVTWEPPAGCRLHPGDPVALEPGAGRPRGMAARRLRVLEEAS